MPARQRYDGAVMKVIVPKCVRTVATLFGRAHDTRFLRLVLGYQIHALAEFLATSASGTHELANDVRLRAVEQRLCRVDAEPVEVILFDPVTRVLAKEIAHGLALGAVEVDGHAPLAL